MSPSSPAGGTARTRRWFVPLLLGAVLLSSVPAFGQAPPTSSSAANPATPHPHSGAAAPVSSALAIPAGLPSNSVNGTFYQNASGFAVAPSANVSCNFY